MSCGHRRLSINTTTQEFSCIDCKAEFSWEEVEQILQPKKQVPYLRLVEPPKEE